MQRSSNRVRQACSQIERRIRDLPAGVPLPTVQQLLREMSVSQATLERAYEQLAARGLIQRRRGKGVFVADRLQTGEFAIVMRPALLGLEASPYYRNVSSHLIQFLHQRGPQWQVRMHLGHQTDTSSEFPATLDLLEPNVLPHLRGIFSFHKLFELNDALEQANVPVVGLGSGGGAASVGYDYFNDFPRQALRHLREVGCKSVGLITVENPRNPRFVPVFLEEAQQAGLVTRPEWMEHEDARASERCGYESFRRFWSNGTRPDGIVVGDDMMANGVLRATLQLGVRLPQDLRLVTFASRRIEFAYHLPVSRIEYDMRDLADRAVQMMLSRIHGRVIPIPHLLLPGRTIKGTTT